MTICMVMWSKYPIGNNALWEVPAIFSNHALPCKNNPCMVTGENHALLRTKNKTKTKYKNTKYIIVSELRDHNKFSRWITTVRSIRINLL